MIRLAILQSDSSHAETYIALVNAPGSPFAGRARVVTLWGEDPNEAAGKAEYGVRACASIDDAVAEADAILVCGRWGDTHHRVAVRALAHGRPLYVDKPLTYSVEEAEDLEARASRAGVVAFSASPLRFAPEIVDLAARTRTAGAWRSGTVVGLAEWAEFGERGRRIFFYGVHAAEILHAVFGPGIAAVRVAGDRGGDVVTVRYGDGRLIALHLLRECRELYAAASYGVDGPLVARVAENSPFYASTMEAIVAMAETGRPPIPLAFAVEIVRFLSAIERARAGDGWVRLADVGTP